MHVMFNWYSYCDFVPNGRVITYRLIPSVEIKELTKIPSSYGIMGGT
ncbi:hypothetical protein Hdeb2414_s0021g00569681 [Helianthus debilis subsp. tardiflorus]